MKLGKVHKDTSDVTRVVVDCSKWLDRAETITAVSLPTIVTDYTPGAVPQGDGQVLYPPDNTPLLVDMPTIAGTNITLMLNDGTPTLAYWVEFLVTGTSGRIKTLELYTHCNPLIPSPYLVNGIYPPVDIIMLPDAPPINPNQLWNNGNMVAVTQDGTRTTPVLNELTVTDRAYIVGYAPLQSPALTGVPTAPTAPPGTNSNQIASTKFVQDVVSVAAGSIIDMAGIGVPGFAIYGVAINNLLCTIQARSMVLGMTVTETAGRPVTLFLGTAPGLQDLVGPFPVAANAIVAVSPLAMSAAAWTAAQGIFIGSSNWNGAVVDAMTWYSFPAGTLPPVGTSAPPGGEAGSGGAVPTTIFASGNSQATATPFGNGDWVIVGGTGGVTMQTTGGIMSVLNATAVSQNVYPMVGARLILGGVAQALNAPLTLPTGTMAWLLATSTTQVYVA